MAAECGGNSRLEEIPLEQPPLSSYSISLFCNIFCPILYKRRDWCRDHSSKRRREFSKFAANIILFEANWFKRMLHSSTRNRVDSEENASLLSTPSVPIHPPPGYSLYDLLKLSTIKILHCIMYVHVIRLGNLYFVYQINVCILTALCVQCKGTSRRTRLRSGQ